MSIGSLEHVLVLAEDLERTRAFYCEVVGLSVGERPPLAFPGFWLYADGAAASCLHIAERPSYAAHAGRLGLEVPVDHAGVGPVDHVAFSAGSWEELMDRLARHGVPVVTNAVPGGPRQVFIEDPNGVRVEINVHGTTVPS